jgi:hypothetical protein
LSGGRWVGGLGGLQIHIESTYEYSIALNNKLHCTLGYNDFDHFWENKESAQRDECKIRFSIFLAVMSSFGLKNGKSGNMAQNNIF